MKDKKHHYNPLESASFKQSQLATILASNVSYFVPYDLYVIHRKLLCMSLISAFSELAAF